MKVAILCCLLFLAGCASAGPVETQKISLPDWFPDVVIPDWVLEMLENLPDSIQNLLDRLPEIIEAIPAIRERIREIIIVIIDRVPALIEAFIDRLPELLAQIPALVDRIRDILNTIVERLPELIAHILEKLPEVIDAVPGIAAQVKEVYDKIREFLIENGWLPDWFPTLPDQMPDWWPPQVPEIPEINTPAPGMQSTIDQYPSIVQIEIGAGPVWAQGCVGSVITNFNILSSARCFSGGTYAPRFRRIRAGSATRYPGGDIVQVQSALNHPDFSTFKSGADISIVRLATNLILGDTIAQIAIVSQDFTIPAFVGVTLAGWGTTAEGKPFANRDLYSIELVTVDAATCAERWNLFSPVYSVPDDALCVGDVRYGGRNGDIRDTGNPVYYQNVLVGIQSMSSPFGNQNFPVITTSVAKYSDWVVANAA